MFSRIRIDWQLFNNPGGAQQGQDANSVVQNLSQMSGIPLTIDAQGNVTQAAGPVNPNPPSPTAATVVNNLLNPNIQVQTNINYNVAGDEYVGASVVNGVNTSFTNLNPLVEGTVPVGNNPGQAYQNEWLLHGLNEATLGAQQQLQPGDPGFSVIHNTTINTTDNPYLKTALGGTCKRLPDPGGGVMLYQNTGANGTTYQTVNGTTFVISAPSNTHP